MKIEQMEKLCELATPGPWVYEWRNLQIECAYDTPLMKLPIFDTCNDERREWARKYELDDKWHYDDDGFFIAHARSLMPKLIAVAKAAKSTYQLQNDYQAKWAMEEIAKALTNLEKDE